MNTKLNKIVQNNNTKQGFSVIEIMVVLAIFFIMTSLSLVNYNRFGREVELENTAYELALTIRQAQFFGINRSEEFGGGTNFDDPQPYGVYFNLESGDVDGINDQGFFMFVDQDNSRRFADTDVSGTGGCLANLSNECVNLYEFNRSNFIYEICVGSNAANCNDITTLLPAGDTTMHVSFKRPNPDAAILIGSGANTTEYAYARITLRAQADNIPDKSISIGAAGLTSID